MKNAALRTLLFVALIALCCGFAALSPAHADSGRPANCPRTAWCGCWLADYFGIRDQKQSRKLWWARAWMSFGHAAPGPAPGVIAVFKRGNRGGHVGIVTAVPSHGIIVLKSGNDNGAVRERPRSVRNVIAWRQP